MHIPHRCIILAVSALFLFCALPALASGPQRTIDSLSPEEFAVLDQLEAAYLAGVREQALTLVRIRFDINTMLRTFPEQVRIIRQRKRALLMEVTKYLYSLGLNPEFVEAHTDRLRDDVLHYALDEMIKKSNTLGSSR